MGAVSRRLTFRYPATPIVPSSAPEHRNTHPHFESTQLEVSHEPWFAFNARSSKLKSWWGLNIVEKEHREPPLNLTTASTMQIKWTIVCRPRGLYEISYVVELSVIFFVFFNMFLKEFWVCLPMIGNYGKGSVRDPDWTSESVFVNGFEYGRSLFKRILKQDT